MQLQVQLRCLVNDLKKEDALSRVLIGSATLIMQWKHAFYACRHFPKTYPPWKVDAHVQQQPRTDIGAQSRQMHTASNPTFRAYGMHSMQEISSHDRHSKVLTDQL
jgi:hypothetical protein